jgi:hypothetical protein
VNENWTDESKSNDEMFWNTVSQTTNISNKSDPDKNIRDEVETRQTSDAQTNTDKKFW